MTTPHVTELPQRLEAVEHDPFIDDLTPARDAARPAPPEGPRNARPGSAD